MEMTPEDQIDCYNGYCSLPAKCLGATYDAYDNAGSSDAKNWLKQQLPSLLIAYGVHDPARKAQLNASQPTIVLGVDGRLYQQISIDLGRTQTPTFKVLEQLSQFPYFSEVHLTDTGSPGCSCKVDVPLLDWPIDAALFLSDVLTRPQSLPAKWRWTTLTKAFAPTHNIEQISSYLAAGLLPENPKSLFLAISDLLASTPSAAVELPSDITPVF